MAVRPVSFIVQTTITKERQHTLTRCALTVRSVQVLDLVYNYFRPSPGCVEAVLSPPRRKPSRKERRIASRTAVWTSLWNWQRWQIWLRLPRATPSHPFSFVSMVSQADKRETLWEQHRVLYIPPNIPVWNSGYCVWRMEQYFPVGWTNPSQVIRCIRWRRRCNFLSVE